MFYHRPGETGLSRAESGISWHKRNSNELLLLWADVYWTKALVHLAVELSKCLDEDKLCPTKSKGNTRAFLKQQQKPPFKKCSTSQSLLSRHFSCPRTPLFSLSLFYFFSTGEELKLFLFSQRPEETAAATGKAALSITVLRRSTSFWQSAGCLVLVCLWLGLPQRAFFSEGEREKERKREKEAS